jgi:hypothetical protein
MTIRLLRVVSALIAMGVLIAAGPAAAPASAKNSALDGRAEIDAESLAALAAERAQLGAQWLARNVRSTGKYNYVYEPTRNRLDNDQYNPVRHAGVTYSLYEAYRAFGDPQIRTAADRGAAFLVEYSPMVEEGRRAYIFAGRSKLGAQALALVALVERRRATGDLAYDAYIRELAEWLMSMELPEEPGRYFQSYSAIANERLLTPNSDYYPGEALLALVRLAQDFPEGPYLEYAHRAAEYLVHVRDGDVPTLPAVPREDQWLAMALSELYLLIPDPAYARVVNMQAASMLANQYTPADQNDWALGASRLRNPVNYTSTATKAEALIAAWRLADARGDVESESRLANGARRTAQFLMRVQYTEESAASFPDPSRLIGAWAQDAVMPYVRMDFVQHNVSALLGIWRQTMLE